MLPAAGSAAAWQATPIGPACLRAAHLYRGFNVETQRLFPRVPTLKAHLNAELPAGLADVFLWLRQANFSLHPLVLPPLLSLGVIPRNREPSWQQPLCNLRAVVLLRHSRLTLLSVPILRHAPSDVKVLTCPACSLCLEISFCPLPA